MTSADGDGEAEVVVEVEEVEVEEERLIQDLATLAFVLFVMPLCWLCLLLLWGKLALALG